VRFHGVPRDDQDVVAQATPIKVFEHREGMRPHGWQKGIGCPVEELERRDVSLEVAVAHELGHCVGIGQQGARLALIPQALGMADAVGAVQRAALDVVQAQPALAVLDDFAGALGQAGALRWRQQGDNGAHGVLFPTMLNGKFGRPIGSVGEQ